MPVKTLSRPEVFLGRLQQIPRREKQRIWGLCLSELRYLKTAPWLPAGATEIKHGYELTTLRSTLRDYRNAIRERLGVTHPALDFLRVSNADVAEYRENYQRQLIDDQSTLRPIDGEALVDVATSVLERAQFEKPFTVAAALCLVTGRRPWEIGCTAVLSKGAGRAKHLRHATGSTLRFSGQAKTKGSDNAQLSPYDIPVLADRDLILDAFEQMRRNYAFDLIETNKQFNRYVGKEINTASQRLFKDQHGVPLTAKDARSAYAAIASSWFRPDDVSLNVFFSRILGHTELDSRTSLSYIDFYEIGEKRELVRDRKSAVKQMMADYEKLIRSERDPELKAAYQTQLDFLRSTLPAVK